MASVSFSASVAESQANAADDDVIKVESMFETPETDQSGAVVSPLSQAFTEGLVSISEAERGFNL